MQGPSRLIVFQEADGRSSGYATRLATLGFHTTACERVDDIREAWRHPIDGVLVVGDAQPASAIVGRIRERDASAALIVVRAGDDVAQRVQALQAGADACYAADVAAIELAAALRAVSRRRLALAAESMPRMATGQTPTDWTSVLHRRAMIEGALGWRLTDGGCTLVSPAGERLRLTASERVLMQQLIGRAGRPLHRDDLAEAGWPSHAGMGANKPRSVDVLISRLRRKAERQGMALPLMAVRRWGYMFLGDVVPSNAAGW